MALFRNDCAKQATLRLRCHGLDETRRAQRGGGDLRIRQGRWLISSIQEESCQPERASSEDTDGCSHCLCIAEKPCGALFCSAPSAADSDAIEKRAEGHLIC